MSSDTLRIVRSESIEVAPGFSVHRAMPLRGFRGQDPFLLLDHFGPLRVRPDSVHGVPEHPHRGFVAVTYMLEGRMHHKDSIGNDVMVEPGDLNWVSTAYGLQHSEFPEPEFVDGVAVLHGFQLWVNLPAKHKLGQPTLQHITANQIPQWSDEYCSVKVLAGTFRDLRSTIQARTELQILHLSLRGGTSFELEMPEGFDQCIYVFGGEVAVGATEEKCSSGELVTLATSNTTTLRHTSETAAELLVLGGRPIGEKVFAHGPFVMNTFEEIQVAIRDYERGEMGFLS